MILHVHNPDPGYFYLLCEEDVEETKAQCREEFGAQVTFDVRYVDPTLPVLDWTV